MYSAFQDPDFYICMISLFLMIGLGLWLAVENVKELERTRPFRVAQRREFKKRKNARLMLFYGIKKRDQSQDQENQ